MKTSLFLLRESFLVSEFFEHNPPVLEVQGLTDLLRSVLSDQLDSQLVGNPRTHDRLQNIAQLHEVFVLPDRRENFQQLLHFVFVGVELSTEKHNHRSTDFPGRSIDKLFKQLSVGQVFNC